MAVVRLDDHVEPDLGVLPVVRGNGTSRIQVGERFQGDIIADEVVHTIDHLQGIVVPHDLVMVRRGLQSRDVRPHKLDRARRPHCTGGHLQAARYT